MSELQNLPALPTLAEFLDLRGWSRRRMARRAGMKETTLYMKLSGQRTLSEADYHALSLACEVHIDYLKALPIIRPEAEV